MQYLVIFTPKHAGKSDGQPADFAEQERREQHQARVLYEQGSARRLWAIDTKDRGAVVPFEADSPTHLQTMLDSFPLVQLDYAGYQIYPLAPHPAFAPR